jgi:hypothetical protein
MLMISRDFKDFFVIPSFFGKDFYEESDDYYNNFFGELD